MMVHHAQYEKGQHEDICEVHEQFEKHRRTTAKRLALLGGGLTFGAFTTYPYLSLLPHLGEFQWSDLFKELYATSNGLAMQARVVAMTGAAALVGYMLPQLNMIGKRSHMRGIARTAEFVVRYGFQLYGNNPPIEAAAKFVRNHTDDPLLEREADAVLHMMHKEYDAAIDCYAATLAVQPEKKKRGLADMIRRVARRSNAALRREAVRESYIPWCIEDALEDFRDGRVDHAKKTFRDISGSASGLQNELTCLYAYFLDRVRDPDAHSMWRTAALLLFQDPQIRKRLRVVHHSKHEFLEYEPSEIVRSSLGFLRGTDHASLHSMYRLYQFLHEVVWSGRPETPVPLAYLSDPEYHYIILGRVRGKRLDDLLHELDGVGESVVCALSALAEFHERAVLSVNRAQQFEVPMPQPSFCQRVWSNLEHAYTELDENALSGLRRGIVPLLTQITATTSKRVYPVHGDYHPGNILCTDQSELGVCILDPEYFTYSLHEVDVAALLEHHTAHRLTSNEHALEHYLLAYRDGQPIQLHESSPEFAARYMPVAFLTNLLYAFHSRRKVSDIGQSQNIWARQLTRARYLLHNFPGLFPHAALPELTGSLETLIAQAEHAPSRSGLQ